MVLSALVSSASLGFWPTMQRTFFPWGILKGMYNESLCARSSMNLASMEKTSISSICLTTRMIKAP